MAKLDLTVGQKVLASFSPQWGKIAVRWATVTKIGRTWAACDNGRDYALEGGSGRCDGKLYLDEKVFLAERTHIRDHDHLRRVVSRLQSFECTNEQVVAAMAALGIPLPEPLTLKKYLK